MDVYDIHAAPDVVAATFIDNENLAIATNTNRDGVSVVKGAPLSSVVDARNPGSVLNTPTLFEVPGRVTSLVADVTGDALSRPERRRRAVPMEQRRLGSDEAG